jgi:hypothetical protein
MNADLAILTSIPVALAITLAIGNLRSGWRVVGMQLRALGEPDGAAERSGPQGPRAPSSRTATSGSPPLPSAGTGS